jgi:hypothetical protein
VSQYIPVLLLVSYLSAISVQTKPFDPYHVYERIELRQGQPLMYFGTSDMQGARVSPDLMADHALRFDTRLVLP